VIKALYDAQDFCQNKKNSIIVNCYLKKRMNSKIMQVKQRVLKNATAQLLDQDSRSQPKKGGHCFHTLRPCSTDHSHAQKKTKKKHKRLRGKLPQGVGLSKIFNKFSF